MKKIITSGCAVLALVLCACTGASPAANDARGQTSSSANARIKFAVENQIFPENHFPLTEEHKAAAKTFLDGFDIPGLSDLKDLGGTKELTPAVCTAIVEKTASLYPDRPLANAKQRCATDSSSLFLTLGDTGGRLILLIDGEGIPGTSFLTSVYDIVSGTTAMVDRDVATAENYVTGDVLTFVAKSDDPVIYMTYNLQTGETAWPGAASSASR